MENTRKSGITQGITRAVDLNPNPLNMAYIRRALDSAPKVAACSLVNQ